MGAQMSSAGLNAGPRNDETRAASEEYSGSSAAGGVGRGTGSGHYGELFQGEIRDEHGILRRCLVTLPCRALQTQAQFTVSPGIVRVHPAGKFKAKLAAELTLEHFDLRGIGGYLALESNIPEGKGNGSSSADCVAAARGVADAIGRTLQTEDLARLVVAAELASDSVMFEQPVLFAHRDGVVLENYGCPLPALEVIGIDADPERCVKTLDHPPATYTACERELFRFLIGLLRQAMRGRDPRLLSEVANLSALINQRFLPNALFQYLHEWSKEMGALGVSVAHSGTVICVLLDPADPRLSHKIERLCQSLAARGIENFQRFRTV